MKIIRTTLAIILLATASVLVGTTPTWPQFRGPNGSGIAEDAHPPIHFGLDTNLLWKTTLPPGHSSPCLWDERIFLTAFDRERKKLETICLDRQTGKVVWRRDTPAEKIERVHPISNPAASTPATDGRTVYVYFGSYGLIAYDFAGGLHWQKALPIAITRFGHGSGTSPILAGDRLILDVHLDQESYVLAVRCHDGETLWKSPKPLFNDGWSTPVVWREGNTELVGILNAGKFAAHDLTTGKERWWVHRVPHQVCATPVIGDGVLYLTGTGVLGERDELILPPPFDDLVPRYDRDQDGRISTDELPETLLIVDRKAAQGAGNMSLRESLLFHSDAKSKSYNREEWDKATRGFHEFARSDEMKSATFAVRTGSQEDVTDSQVVWTETKSISDVPSPLLYRDRLYYVKNGGVLICRDPANGRLIFEERLGASGGYYASPVAADGRIYTASDRGVITVLSAGDQLQVLARADLQEAIMATPAIADLALYVRSAAHLWAFGEPKPAKP
ncbi:MAG: PQQ-binding-like beta-propeller repeat protein [Candidatus Zixiibacteriota bacterium]|nr:MAG: PQQ-binding-like beta-propeller repeat protein [candidate division Zixibacteria bacterium]